MTWWFGLPENVHHPESLKKAVVNQVVNYGIGCRPDAAGSRRQRRAAAKLAKKGIQTPTPRPLSWPSRDVGP